MGHVDHNGRRLVGLKGAIVDFCPQRSGRARWACLHTAFVLSAVATGHRAIDEFGAGTSGDPAPSLTPDVEDFHRIGNRGSAHFLDSPAATASAARSPAPRSTSGALGGLTMPAKLKNEIANNELAVIGFTHKNKPRDRVSDAGELRKLWRALAILTCQHNSESWAPGQGAAGK